MEPKKSHKGAIGVLIALLVVAGIVAASSRSNTQEKMMIAEKATMEQKSMMDKDAIVKDDALKSGDTMIKDNAMMKKEGAMMEKGSYEVYAPEKLAWAKDGKVVLFFKASWCPSCKAVDADIKARLAAIPTGTHILEVDYDTSTELKKKYGVTYQHTFVQVDSSGTQIAKWSGSPTLSALLTNVK